MDCGGKDRKRDGGTLTQSSKRVVVITAAGSVSEGEL